MYSVERKRNRNRRYKVYSMERRYRVYSVQRRYRVYEGFFIPSIKVGNAGAVAFVTAECTRDEG